LATLLIANNCTRECGQFLGDQLCYLKAAHLFARNAPEGTERVIMSMSLRNEMGFLWEKFLEDPRGDGSLPPVEVIWDDLDPGDNDGRWRMWDRWRADRVADGRPFDSYRELYLRIHGAVRQCGLCGAERGLGRANIFEYLWFGQEDAPEAPPRDVDEWECHGVRTRYSYGEGLLRHPPRESERDVYISPHAKTQGNVVFSFDFWSDVVHRLIDAGVTVTVGYNGYFCEELNAHPLYKKHWGDHRQWMEQVCRHKIVACGNTGTGWLAAACGVPMVTMEPPGSQMPDHRYRQCGLRNIVELFDEPDPRRVADRIVAEVRRCVVMTTGCYDVLHAGHVRHLERSRALGTRLVVALNSDASVRSLKGPERPVNPQNQRQAVLEALRCVDEVRVFDGPDARALVEEVRPEVLTAGYGYTAAQIVGRDLVEARGGRVLVTCEGDARDEPSTTKIVRRARSADVVEACRAAAPYTVCPFEKLKVMAEQLLSVRDLPGDVADLGAGAGGTSLVLRRLGPDKHLHVFDTWEGNPHNDPLCHHKKGEWVANAHDCMKLLGPEHVSGGLTHYHQGVFPQEIGGDPVDDKKWCFVFVDVDTYQSTRDALAFFWPRMVPGGKVVVDDYDWLPCAGVKKAVDEVFPPEESERYATLPGVAKRTVVGNICILEKR
jgi:rfaE bifunctional protein nucleotidyltransferase chain/domain